MSGRTLILLDVTKRESKYGDTKRLAKLMDKLMQRPQQYRMSLAFQWDGYNDIPDEVYAIPEIRDWCAKVFKEHPYIFYFLAQIEGGVGMGNFLAAIGDVMAEKPMSLHKPTSDLTETELLTGYPVLVAFDTEVAKQIVSETRSFARSIGDSAEDILAGIPGMEGL